MILTTMNLRHGLILFLLLFALRGAQAQPSTADAPHADRLHAPGVRFMENRGQIVDSRGALRPDIIFRAEANNTSIYFRREGISYVFITYEGDPREYVERQERHGEDEKSVTEGGAASVDPIVHFYRMDMELMGASPGAGIEGEELAADRANYYLPHSPRGIEGVRSYRRLIYRDVYPNIDMVVNGSDSGMKCDFVVRPGGDPARIRMNYTGGNARVDGDGRLEVITPLGSMTMSAPFTYQRHGAEQRMVASHYTADDGVIGFSVGDYDRTRPLVIDPVQVWGTFLGGSSAEELAGGNPGAIDRSGNVLIVGSTTSSATQAFPVTPGASQGTLAGNFDAFIVKFSPTGALLWSTYWGGMRDELLHGVAADSEGNVFTVGHTLGASPNNLPVLNALQPTYGPAISSSPRDAIAAKFSPTGAMIWATYLGGNHWDDAYGCAVDHAGNLIIGVTTGSNFTSPLNGPKPNPPGSNDQFMDVLLVKLSGAGTLIWSYYYGGTNMEYLYGVAADAHDDILITGWTASSTGFPLSGAAQATFGGSTDAFVAKLSSAGVLRWSSYYGGSGKENYTFTESGVPGGPGYSSITSDPAGNVFITGFTTGSFPVTEGAFQGIFSGGKTDAFCVKLDSNGNRRWATYIGGAGQDIGAGVAAGNDGGVYVAGMTSSMNFPVTFPPSGVPAFRSSFQGGSWDAFIVTLNGDGEEKWGTYFGGEGDDEGRGVAFDPHGALAILGLTSSTEGRFPLLNAFQTTNRGNLDIFASLFCDPVPPVIDLSGPSTFDASDSVTLSVVAGYGTVEWYRVGEPNELVGTGDDITIRESGEWYVKVKSPAGCTSISVVVRTTRRPPSSVPEESVEDLIEWLSDARRLNR